MSSVEDVQIAVVLGLVFGLITLTVAAVIVCTKHKLCVVCQQNAVQYSNATLS